MGTLNQDQRDAAINIGFELAKFGVQHFLGRQLAKEEEQELLDHLREHEAQREFKTPSELTGVVLGATGVEE